MFDDVQKIAEEILTLDSKKDKEVILKKKWKMMTITLGFSKNIDGRAYYPLLEQGLRGTIPHEDFDNILLKLLEELILNGKYDPKRARFSTALSFFLNNRIRTYLRDNRAELNAISMEELYAIHGDENEPDYRFEDADSYKDMFNKWTGFGDILKKYEQEIERLHNNANSRADKKSSHYYQGFFTFDTTKTVKKYKELAEAACEQSGKLFPYLIVNLLSFLMIRPIDLPDSFNEMIDVVNTPLRKNIDLEKRGEMLEKYYEKAHPTINTYSQKYDEFKNSIYGVTGENRNHSF